MRTCDRQRIKGWWFLPSSPDDRLPGVLTWSQEEGAELELFGGFSNQPERAGVDSSRTGSSSGSVVPRTIYGETVAGKPVTLWEAGRGSHTADFSGRAREEMWHSAWVCVGAHIPSVETPTFRRLTVGLDHLYDLTSDGRFSAPSWTPMDGVDHPWEEQDDGTYLTPYVLPVVGGRRAGVSVGSTSTTTYSVETWASRPWISPATEAMPDLRLEMMRQRTRGGHQIHLSVSASFRVVPLDETTTSSAADFLNKLGPLHALMAVATFSASGVERMHAETAAGDDVSILCRLGYPSAPESPAPGTDVVFTLDDVSLRRFLQEWERLTSGPQAQYAWNLAVGLIGHSARMVEEHVSQVLAAAEGFHRWCLGKKGEQSLRARLQQLHDRLPSEVSRRLGLDVEKWADWSVWARNHVAHGGAKRHRELGDFYQLKVIADSVRLVTYLVILCELGVAPGKVTDALTNHPRIKVLAARSAQVANLPEP